MNDLENINKNNYVYDVDENNFEEEIINKSLKGLILLDFWAPWCGPCKQLTPLLEKIINKCKGKVFLAKINIDENQQIAAQFRIQSIPSVFAFQNKKIVDAFQGVLPQEKIIQFIEKHLGENIEKDNSEFYKNINELIAKKDQKSALSLLEDFISSNSEDLKSIQLYLNCLIDLSKFEEANEFISSLSKDLSNSQEIKSTITKLKMKINNNEGPTLEEYKKVYEKDPSNIKNVLSLSEKLFANNLEEDCFELLLKEYKNNNEKNKEQIKKILIKYFETLGADDERTKNYRRKFSSIMFA